MDANDPDIEDVPRDMDFPIMFGQDRPAARAWHNGGAGLNQAGPLARPWNDALNPQQAGFPYNLWTDGLNQAVALPRPWNDAPNPRRAVFPGNLQAPVNYFGNVFMTQPSNTASGRVEYLESPYNKCSRCGDIFQTAEAMQQHHRLLQDFCEYHTRCVPSWRHHIYEESHTRCPVRSCAKWRRDFGSNGRFIQHFRDKHW